MEGQVFLIQVQVREPIEAGMAVACPFSSQHYHMRELIRGSEEEVGRENIRMVPHQAHSPIMYLVP